ncbi:MAG TPA: hypothetical protein PLP61_05235 [Nocardioides sp.]|uniref:hypothetical protein n=1 Tax=Nocardioides sp. TaxID=35761 RepID=UPI002C5C2881|nr:hypothetical protein [Nocardioides sp.]HQR26425.1 hypothetical protein [Nocardioides sp.]
MKLTTRRTAASGAILAATALGVLTVSPSQGAVPILDPVGLTAHHPSPTLTQVTPTHERPCFTWRSTWNESLDAPEPTCPLTPRH